MLISIMPSAPRITGGGTSAGFLAMSDTRSKELKFLKNLITFAKGNAGPSLGPNVVSENGY